MRLKGKAHLFGHYSPPGDKSISHRAIMFGALGEGRSRYENFLFSGDCLATAKAFQSLGVAMQLDEKTNTVDVRGVGLKGLKLIEGVHEIDLGNSGTSMRLLLGILAGQKMELTLTGDESLSSRPMKRVTAPLKKMGAQIKGRDNANFAPLLIRGGKLTGMEFENNLGSAQLKSCLLLAGLYAEGETVIHERYFSRDHTERFLKAVGAPFTSEGNILKIKQADSLKPLNFRIPGDISSAAFFLVGAAMTPGSDLTIEQVGLNETRVGLLEVLKRMGADILIENQGGDPEPVGRIRIRGAALKGTRISKQEIPFLIDEIPILMIAMAVAEGESIISGAEELRVKETDRIHSMVTNLNAVGGHAEELPDGCLIQGKEEFVGGVVDSFGDHRTAMSFAIASLKSSGEIQIKGDSCISTSFPKFFDHFEALKRT